MDNEISLLREILQEIENIIIEGHEFGLVDEVTDGDTTHAVTPNAVYHAIAERIIPDVIKIVTDKGTASADTMNKLYIEVANDTADVYYTVENNSTYTWKKLDDDILDNLSIDWSDVDNKPLVFPPSTHTHSIGDLPTANTITDGDTSHVVSADVIHDYIDSIIGDADDWLTS